MATKNKLMIHFSKSYNLHAV